jgi:hypothetical protein
MKVDIDPTLNDYLSVNGKEPIPYLSSLKTGKRKRSESKEPQSIERKPQRIPSIELSRHPKANLKNAMEDIIEKESEDRETNHIVDSKG